MMTLICYICDEHIEMQKDFLIENCPKCEQNLSEMYSFPQEIIEKKRLAFINKNRPVNIMVFEDHLTGKKEYIDVL